MMNQGEELLPDKCERASGVVFYGIDGDGEKSRGFFDLGCQLANDWRSVPTRMSVHGEGFANKVTSFTSSSKRLSRIGFDGVDGFCGFVLTENGSIPVRDGVFVFDFSLKNSYVAITVADSILETQPQADLSVVATEIARTMEPSYGFHFRWELPGASTYPVGIMDRSAKVREGMTLKQARDHSFWGLEGLDENVYRQGVIRDVYCINYLNEVQLDMRIGEITLREWIESEEVHGSLSPFVGSLTTWRVDQSCSRSLAEQLRSEGLVYQAP